eukprot:CAMPEP_0196825430 /NCGR_PEP_ID=MMETSP1362-20130617/93050_1 /TAXON_ID=163516 /ORGANISM="Leptocylindrus danicus, Strain CCMP1856" /LENGTH=359 /DNA_ID=CAMNT_0042205853 /DNA_START=101 /DNA_END=1180 /DNA_ORIENTATION=+
MKQSVAVTVQRNNKGHSFEEFLPRDVLSTIFTYLTFHDMAACCQVSKVWSQFLDSVKDISIAMAKRWGESVATRVAILEFATKRFHNLTSIGIVFHSRLNALRASSTGTRLAIRDLLAKNYRQLQQFYFVGQYNALGFALEPLAKATNLRSLTLDRYRFINLNELMSLLDNKPNLRSFTCKNLKFHDTAARRGGHTLDDLFNSFIHFRIGNMHNLRELTLLLDDIHFADDSLDWSILFAKLVKLERLEIDYLDDAGALTLAQYCPNLRFLDLDLCRDVSFPSVLEVLRRCPIQSLKVSEMWEQSRSFTVQKMCEASETLTNITVGGAEYDVTLREIMKETAHDAKEGRMESTLSYSDSD